MGWGMMGKLSLPVLTKFTSISECLLTAFAPLLSFIEKAWGFQSTRPRADTFVNASDIILELL